MAWVLTKSLHQLRTDFNIRFPARDKASDGSIGDPDHASRTSGHNPDDTTGVSAEYQDADTKQEVRAIDVDKDLRSTVTMQQVINQILATPNDTKRLKYIIFNRKQWSKSNGWRVQDYTGINPHTEHAHFSGDPLYDEDGSPWSVLEVGMADEVIPLSWQEDEAFRVEALSRGRNATTGGPSKGEAVLAWARIAQELKPQLDSILAQSKANGETLSRIETKLNALAIGGMDPEELSNAIRAELDTTKLSRLT